MGGRYVQQIRRAPAVSFWLLLKCSIFCFLFSLLFISQTANAASNHVDVLKLNDPINPATVRLLARAIEQAERGGASALVIEIDTPGGDIDSMNTMVKLELASKVPIIAYVSPAGSQAASAGAFVTLSAHVAAMAPTTRIGAASPVMGSGRDIDSTLRAKIVNDLSALMASIQNRYGRNAPLAEKMITEATSYDDATAVEKKIVDVSAPDLKTLLALVDGRSVLLEGGRTLTLQTAGARVETINSEPIDTFYTWLFDPNVIFLLFVIAMFGIYLEISHPGVIVPGVVGAIALILFLFAIGSLSLNWAGLALLFLSFVLLILDVQLPAHGILTAGAVFSLITGAFLLFNSDDPYGGQQIDPMVIYVTAGMIGILGFTLVTYIVRVRRLPVTTGIEGMIGAKVTALTPLHPGGRVRYGGENWAAILETPATSADKGSELEITTVEGLRLHVRPVRSQNLMDRYSESTSEVSSGPE